METDTIDQAQKAWRAATAVLRAKHKGPEAFGDYESRVHAIIGTLDPVDAAMVVARCHPRERKPHPRPGAYVGQTRVVDEFGPERGGAIHSVANWLMQRAKPYQPRARTVMEVTVPAGASDREQYAEGPSPLGGVLLQLGVNALSMSLTGFQEAVAQYMLDRPNDAQLKSAMKLRADSVVGVRCALTEELERLRARAGAALCRKLTAAGLV